MAEIDQSFSTIVSLLPFELTELKSGLFPNEYIIAKMNGDLGLTVIPNDVYYLVNPDVLADEKSTRNIKVPVPAHELAQSIINDYVSALLAVDPPVKVPGLFAVKGNYTDPKVVRIKFDKELKTAQQQQNGWFENLVVMADDTWSKTHSPVGISDIQRHAARSLGIKRDWLDPVLVDALTVCPVCKNAVNMGALKCTACNFIINPVEYNKLVGANK